jgi:hypothetical protein
VAAFTTRLRLGSVCSLCRVVGPVILGRVNSPKCFQGFLATLMLIAVVVVASLDLGLESSDLVQLTLPAYADGGAGGGGG